MLLASDDDLRKYADTWIHVVTVLLAGEIIALIFLYEGVIVKSLDDIIISTFGTVMIGITGLSLAIFVIGRDPRSNLPISNAIDAGIITFVISILVILTGLYINDIIILKGLILPATILYVFEIIAVSLFYPIMRYFTKNK